MSIIAALTQDLLSIESPTNFPLISKLKKLSIQLPEILANKKSCTNSTSKNLHEVFMPYSNVIDIAISSSYIAFLLSTNHVCRVKYRVLPLESKGSFGLITKAEGLNITLSKSNVEKNDAPINDQVLLSPNTFIPTRRQKPHGEIAYSSTLDPTYMNQGLIDRGSAIRYPKNTGRVSSMRNIPHDPPNIRRSFLINPSHSLVPSSEIPEELIQQAQAVLQGKSRSVIIRELQRTGIDVNQAVNNLLSKDDDGDDDESVPTSLIGTDELFYLIESGGRTVQMPMEIDAVDEENIRLDPSIDPIHRFRDFQSQDINSGRESRLGFSNSNISGQFDHISDILSSYPSIPLLEPLNNTCKDSSNKKDEFQNVTNVIELQNDVQEIDWTLNKGSNPMLLSPRVEFYPHVEWWVDGGIISTTDSSEPPSNGLLFTSISATDADLIAVSTSGHLAYWPWNQKFGYYSSKEHSCPNNLEIGLKSNDHVKFLSTSRFRIAIVTSGGALASWCDRGLGQKISKSLFETPLQHLRLNGNQSVIALSCCDIYSACLTTGGVIYWWGCMPYIDRKKAIARIKNKYRTNVRKCGLRNTSRPEFLIKEGDNVFIKDSPYYPIGSLGLYIHKEATFATLQENIYSLNERCRFKSYHTTELNENKDYLSDEKKSSLSSEHSYSSSLTHTWHSKDVVFLDEPLFHSSLGNVKKIDGNFAVVHIPSNSEENAQNLPFDLTSCRIVRKEELILQRPGNYHKGPVCIQLLPKKLLIPPDCIPLNISADTKGLHLLYIQDKTPKLSTILLENSRFYNSLFFPKSMYAYFAHCRSLKITLGNANMFQTTIFIRDVSGNFLPFIKSHSNIFKEIPYFPLAPISAFTCYQDIANKFALSVLSCKKQILTPHLIFPDPQKISSLIERPKCGEVFFSKLLHEKTNSDHNILHTAINSFKMHRKFEAREFSSPIHNNFHFNDSTQENNHNIKKLHAHSKINSYTDEKNYRKVSVVSNHRYVESTSAVSPYSSNAEPSDSDQDFHESIPKPSSISKISILTLDCMDILINSLGSHAIRLLSEKNIDGLTPFMQAIHQRAYDCALMILSYIINLSKSPPTGTTKNDFLLSMLYPIDSFRDDNPLLMLCANDSCSVTWTGETHEKLIDIYECHTCGLVGDFCCCTECSLVCHRGHEIFRKLQPMKAFCDCRKLCCCQGLFSGNQDLRTTLFNKLITNTNLYTLTNSNGEYILSFLINTYSRQVREQGHKKQHLSLSKSSRMTYPSNEFFFSKVAMEMCLKNWFLIETMFAASSLIPSCGLGLQPNFLNDVHNCSSKESNPYLDNQKGSTHIDTFVYSLLNLNNSDLIIQLLSTFSQAHRDKLHKSEYIISRFIRSVIRIYLISCYDVWGSHVFQNKKHNQHLNKSVHLIFRCFNTLSIKELWSIACSIVTPIQLGIVKPCVSIPNELRKKFFADEFFKTRPNIIIDSKINRIHQNDSDDNSSSDISEEINSTLDSESYTTPGNISETTRATIGSSHIVPYFSGDSGSDSEDIHVDDGLNINLEAHISAPQMQSLQQASGTNQNLPSNASESVLIDPLSHLITENNVLTGQWGEGNLADEVQNSFSNPPNFQQFSSNKKGQDQLPSNYAVAQDQNWYPSNFSDQLWRPSFDLISDMNNSSTQSKRVANYINNSHDNCKSSHSCQEQLLARAFHFLIIQLVNTLQSIKDQPEYSIPCSHTEILEINKTIWDELEPLLYWLIQVMDPLESQLRFGSFLASPYSSFLSVKSLNGSMVGKSDKYIPAQRLNQMQNNSFSFGSDASRSPRCEAYSTPASSSKGTCTIGMESLDYLLSLTRSNSCEHREFIPHINLRSMEHIAQVLDAVLFYLYCQCDLVNINSEKDKSVDLSLLSQGDYLKPNFENLDPENSFSQKNCRINAYYIPSKEILQVYFKRSPCLSFIGCPNPSYLSPIESIPIAEMPHLLQPHTRREVLFGAPQDPIFPDQEKKSPFHSLNRLSALLSLPLIKSFSHCHHSSSLYFSKYFTVTDKNIVATEQLDFKRAANVLMGRWRFTIELFCKLIMTSKKNENIKILKFLEDFPTKETRFRDEMEKLTFDIGKEQREILFEISRDRSQIILDTFGQLHTFVEERRGLLTPLCVKQVKVTFKNEQGEGSGVSRSFYTCLAEAVLTDENLPLFDDFITNSPRDLNEFQLVPLNVFASPFHPHYITSNIEREKVLQGSRIYPSVVRLIGLINSDKVTGMLLNLPSSHLNHMHNNNNIFTRYVMYAYETLRTHLNSPFAASNFNDLNPSIHICNLIGSNLSYTSGETPNAKRVKKSVLSELSPLFFQPGKNGIYSPRAGKYTTTRQQCYLCIGRIIGLCLLTNEIFPISFSRHVLKFLLGKESSICWQDYAFMDPVSFESLRKLLLLVKDGDIDSIKSMGLTFEISLSPFESDELVDLVENGGFIPVILENAHYYVKLYTEYRMKVIVWEALMDMQLGLSEVIPAVFFTNITPEDLRLLLNGCNSFNIESFKNIVGINNESRHDDKLILKFMRWFWDIVFGFSEREKQDLLYFWTSSPNIPASIDSYQPAPSIHIRPCDDEHLPTANTCIHRLYIPLYSRKAILKSKVSLAIKTKIFGFV